MYRKNWEKNMGREEAGNTSWNVNFLIQFLGQTFEGTINLADKPPAP